MFSLELKVRDYECDLQSVVNNAIYQHYMEHARHEFLHSINVDFAELAAKKIDLMVLKAELEYKAPLRPGDVFYITVEMARESRIKYAFIQNLYRKSDDQLMVKSKFIGVAVDASGEKSRPMAFEPFDYLLASD